MKHPKKTLLLFCLLALVMPIVGVGQQLTVCLPAEICISLVTNTLECRAGSLSLTCVSGGGGSGGNSNACHLEDTALELDPSRSAVPGSFWEDVMYRVFLPMWNGPSTVRDLFLDPKRTFLQEAALAAIMNDPTAAAPGGEWLTAAENLVALKLLGQLSAQVTVGRFSTGDGGVRYALSTRSTGCATCGWTVRQMQERGLLTEEELRKWYDRITLETVAGRQPMAKIADDVEAWLARAVKPDRW